MKPEPKINKILMWISIILLLSTSFFIYHSFSLKNSLKTTSATLLKCKDEVDSLKQNYDALKLKYDICTDENIRISKENYSSKYKLSIKDEECDHEKDMLFIERSIDSNDAGELLSRIGQYNSLSDAERIFLSEKANKQSVKADN